MLGLMSDQQLSISSLIEHSGKYHGETEIVDCNSNSKVLRTNYKNTLTRVKKLASSLIKLNVKRGDRVGTLAWSNLSHLELYYSISGIGAVCHTINPRLFEEQIVFIINDARNKLLFVAPDFLNLIESIIDRLTSVETIIVLGNKEDISLEKNNSKKIIAYEDLLQHQSTLDTWPSFPETTASSLCYTSGTTGNPKGVLYSHRSTILHTIAAANPDSLNLSCLDVIMPIAPMFHANAWGIPYVATMVGAKLVLPGRNLDGESIYNLLENEKVTFTAAVPTIWLMLFQYLEQENKKLNFLKSCAIGGSACPKVMIENFAEKHNVKVIHAWGMTETSPLGTVNRPLNKHENYSKGQKYDLATKQGRPVYGVDIKVEDDNGKELPRDGKSSGNLWVKGPWICKGYMNIDNSDVHRDDGWFLTGDVANIDKDGYMQITDRVKDVIKSGGEWISTIEIENIAIGHPNVKEAAVIGVKHKKWDERPLLLIVKNKEVSKNEIYDYLLNKVAKWWMPDDILFLEDLPHTATGKIKKIDLKNKYINHLIS
jgi:fatty-acyl-CoA synthase